MIDGYNLGSTEVGVVENSSETPLGQVFKVFEVWAAWAAWASRPFVAFKVRRHLWHLEVRCVWLGGRDGKEPSLNTTKKEAGLYDVKENSNTLGKNSVKFGLICNYCV